jgi:hypothetical protein
MGGISRRSNDNRPVVQGKGKGTSRGAAQIVQPIKQATKRPPAVSPTPRSAFSKPVNDAEIVNAICDTLQKQPPTLEQWYIDCAIWVANYFKISSLPVPTQPAPAQTTPLYGIWGNLVRSVTNPTTAPTNQQSEANCFQAIAAIKTLAEKIADFSARAKNAGFEPPDNPFTVFAQFNADRGSTFDPINITLQYASDLVFNIKTYINLIAVENQGGINFSKENAIDKAQLAHVSLSFNGIGGSGNVAADIMSFLPDADQIKQNIAAEELAVLDFTRRVPYVLFTLDYKSDGVNGVLVGWKKIPDASGFMITRHAAFNQTDYQWNVDNKTIKSHTERYINYVKLHALAYLEDIDTSSVQLFLDDNLQQDEYYVYTLQAFQYRSDMKGKLFSGKSAAAPMSTWTTNQITELMQEMDPDMRQIVGWQDYQTPIYQTFPTTISPWPAYAQVLLTDSAYDWILAAVNIRASVNRGDDRVTTRKYSYLNAQHEFLQQQAAKGKLVVPGSLDDAIKSVENSIEQFGVTQTILEILQETGITYHFDGRDPRDNGLFDRAGSNSNQESSIFHVIGSAIDPDTATVDVKAVAHNMAELLKQPGTTLNLNTNFGETNQSGIRQQPSELFIPDPTKTTDANADSGFQFISRLGNMDDSTIDLTTFDGISKLIRVIRIYSDFGPDKVKSTHVDPPPPPAPPPPPPPPPTPPPQQEEVVEEKEANEPEPIEDMRRRRSVRGDDNR